MFRVGFLIGGAFGLLIALILQLEPRFDLNRGNVFTGVPQGTDQYVYMALCRAVYRSPTQFTYSYPFAAPENLPPVMLQIPITAIAWIGRVTGLVWAFEVARVLGCAFSGGAIAVIGCALFRPRRWRTAFYIAAVACGSLFAWYGLLIALRLSSVWGLSEWYEYQRYAAGPIYLWMPYVAQNAIYPMEATYHALVFGTFACILTHRNREALLLGAVAWFSNPFPAIGITAPLLLWWAWRTLFLHRTDRFKRLIAVRNAAAWLAVAGIGIGYYKLFLTRWPSLKDVADGHMTSLAPALSVEKQFFLLFPWIIGLIWSIATPGGRRHVWHSVSWSCVALIVVTQLLFMEQPWLLGDKSLQPYHLNRGYLNFFSAALFMRMVFVLSSRRSRLPRAVVFILLLTAFDQPLFFMQRVLAGFQGSVEAVDYRIIQHLKTVGESRVVLSEHPNFNVVIAALTHHRVFHAPDTMAVPHADRRRAAYSEAAAGKSSYRSLGLDYVLASNAETMALLEQQGWKKILTSGDRMLYERPVTASDAIVP